MHTLQLRVYCLDLDRVQWVERHDSNAFCLEVLDARFGSSFRVDNDGIHLVSEHATDGLAILLHLWRDEILITTVYFLGSEASFQAINGPAGLLLLP